MRAQAQPSSPAAFGGVDELLETVPPVDPAQGFFMHRFQPELEPEVRAAGNIGDEIEHVVAHAVGTRGDGEADHARHLQRLPVESLQLTERPIGVAVALEIGDKVFRSVALSQRLDSLLQLLAHGHARAVGPRGMAGVVAVGASPHGDAPVPVRTGEVHSQADLVNAAVKSFFEDVVEGVVAPAAPCFF